MTVLILYRVLFKVIGVLSNNNEDEMNMCSKNLE